MRKTWSSSKAWPIASLIASAVAGVGADRFLDHDAAVRVDEPRVAQRRQIGPKSCGPWRDRR